jgi:hypothetical protein
VFVFFCLSAAAAWSAPSFNEMWQFKFSYCPQVLEISSIVHQLSCLVCCMSPKQVWSWQLVVAAALLFSQCNVVWRSFCGLVVQGVEVLILLGALFLPSVAPASKQDF